MPRRTIPLSPKEYAERQERSAWIWEALRVQKIPAYILAAAVKENPNTTYRHLKQGLTEDQFDRLRDAITRISLYRLADGGENRG